MMPTKWIIDSNQSDVLFKARHSVIAFLANDSNKFSGTIDVVEDKLENASVEFFIDVNQMQGKLERMESNLRLNDFFDTFQNPTIFFKSTSFQKVNSNINFLKGDLTINNITKTVELDAVLNESLTNNGNYKPIFEVNGKINRKDFGLMFHNYNEIGGLSIGQDIELIANIEFSN